MSDNPLLYTRDQEREARLQAWEDIIELDWQEYVSQQVNFGDDDFKTRLAEEDAYKAGARKMLEQTVPF